MRKPFAALPAAFLLGFAVIQPALAQVGADAPPAPPSADAGAKDGTERPLPPSPPASPLWMVSEKLAAAEIALGITTEQETVWRDFTASAVRFVEAGRPSPNMSISEAGEPLSAEEEVSDAGALPSRMANNRQVFRSPTEHLRDTLERDVRRGEAARDLLAAMDRLTQALAPDQRERADRLLVEFSTPGLHGKQGPHGGPKPPHAPEPKADRPSDDAGPPRFDKPSLFTR